MRRSGDQIGSNHLVRQTLNLARVDIDARLPAVDGQSSVRRDGCDAVGIALGETAKDLLPQHAKVLDCAELGIGRRGSERLANDAEGAMVFRARRRLPMQTPVGLGSPHADAADPTLAPW